MKLNVLQNHAEYYSLYYSTQNARKCGNVIDVVREGNFISLYYNQERIKRFSGKSSASHIELTIRDICDYLNENAELFYKMMGLGKLFMQNRGHKIMIQYQNATEAFHKHCDLPPWRIKL